MLYVKAHRLYYETAGQDTINNLKGDRTNICAKECPHAYYRASTAQRRYEQRQLRSRKDKLLDDKELFALVARCFLEDQWSPEQIEGRLALEEGRKISNSTIYRAIASGAFDKVLSGRKASYRLKRKGRRPRKRSEGGEIKMSHEIGERLKEANERSRLGDWEGDTMTCKQDHACLVTLTDRKAGFLQTARSQRRDQNL